MGWCRRRGARSRCVHGRVATQAFGWESVFFVNVPLAGVAMWLAFTLIARDGKRELERKFDLPGALSATAGVTLLVFSLVQGSTFGWHSPVITGSAVLSLLLLVGFTLIEWNSADPLVQRELLASRYVRTAVAIAFLFMATFGSVLYFLSIYLQDVHGYDAMDTGLGFLMPTGVVVASSGLAGPMATRFGLRPTMIAALSVGAVGAVTLAWAMSADSAGRAESTACSRCGASFLRSRRSCGNRVSRGRVRSGALGCSGGSIRPVRRGSAAPLAIGSVQLDVGEWVKGFVCEPLGVVGATEITQFGGWRACLADQKNSM
jgi:MFS family permease